MDTLLAYLNSLSPAEQREFARRCATSVGYLRKAISTGQNLGAMLCIAIDRESGGRVRVEDLRPDVDWAYLRGTPRDLEEGPAAPSQPSPLPESGEGATSAQQVCAPASIAEATTAGRVAIVAPVAVAAKRTGTDMEVA